MTAPMTREELQNAIDSPTVAALEHVFNGPGVLGKSYSEMIVEILAPRLLNGVAQGPAWCLIETAPRDGTPMLFCNYDDPEQDVLPIVSGFWSRLSEGWYAELSGQKIAPTHWRPLLAPPTLMSSTDRGGK